MIITKSLSKQIFKKTRDGVGWILGFYVKQVFFEEALFRYVGIFALLWLFWQFHWYGIAPWWVAILTINIVWSLLHLVGFTWEMSAVCFPLGLLLGWLMYWFVHPFGFILAVGIHTGVGALGYKLGILQKWIR